MRERPAPGEPFGRRLYFAEGEIDRICLDALESAGCLPATPSPIEVDLLAEKHFGCAVTYEDLAPGWLGFAVFGDRGSVVALGVAKSLFDGGTVGERRARATLAHEAGHCLLHANLFGGAHQPHPLLHDSFDYDRRRIMCRKEDIGMATGGYDGKWWEWQANQAIGGLLLPRHLVEACVASLTNGAGALGPAELPRSKREQAVRRVAATFEVNPAVARIRLEAIFPGGDQLSL